MSSLLHLSCIRLEICQLLDIRGLCRAAELNRAWRCDADKSWFESALIEMDNYRTWNASNDVSKLRNHYANCAYIDWKRVAKMCRSFRMHINPIPTALWVIDCCFGGDYNSRWFIRCERCERIISPVALLDVVHVYVRCSRCRLVTRRFMCEYCLTGVVRMPRLVCPKPCKRRNK